MGGKTDGDWGQDSRLCGEGASLPSAYNPRALALLSSSPAHLTHTGHTVKQFSLCLCNSQVSFKIIAPCFW